MAENVFTLKWAMHSKNLARAFQCHQNDGHFCDVSIACEDKVIEAHKLVLSASSLVFNNILKKYSHPHPLIYLKGIKAVDMDSLLEFVYCGEVKVGQDQLKSFIAAAEELMVQGLTGSVTGDETSEKAVLEDTQLNCSRPETSSSYKNHPQKMVKDEVLEESSCNEKRPKEQVKEWADLKKFVATTKKKDPENGFKMRTMHKCKLCGTTYRGVAHLMDHIERIHFKKVIDNTCTICGKKLNSRTSLRCHKLRKHGSGALRVPSQVQLKKPMNGKIE